MSQFAPNASAFISNAFTSQTFVANQIDVQQEPIYDTITTAASGTLSTGSPFFVNVGASTTKTLAQTNVLQSQRLPSPEAFSIFSPRLWFSSDILLADAVAILKNFALQFIMGNKSYNTGPLWHYCAGGGIYGAASTTANNTTISAWTNGLPTREAQIALQIPIVIENGMNFYAQLVGTSTVMTAAASGGVGSVLTLLLDGLHARGVQ
jgi:hypothetical protein